MQYALLNNDNISSEHWVYRMDTDDPATPFFVAKIHLFGTDLETKEYLQDTEGVQVPGKPWALVFYGVMDSTRVKISLDFEYQVRQFLEGAAAFLQKIAPALQASASP